MKSGNLIPKRFLVLPAGALTLLGALAGLINLDPASMRSSRAASPAQNFIERAKLLANDGASGDQLGYSVAISGDTAVVGAPFDDTSPDTNHGSIYVFVRSGGGWAQQAKLKASDGAENDEFGFSVAISGDTIVVGAHEDDVGTNTNQGSAYVFVRSGGVWTQQQKLAADDGEAGDDFGFSVAISDETVVVGARYDDIGPETHQGSAYVFARSGANWTRQQKLTASDGSLSEEFGYSVAISGATVAIGARSDRIGTAGFQGSAYVFARSGANWTQQAKLTASDGAANDYFGSSISLSGETVAIGAPFDDLGATAQGSAYVFVSSGGVWMQQAKLTANDGAQDDYFGYSVSISGETAVVGARFDDVNAPNQGSAYVFARSGANWTQQQKLTASDGAASDQLGYSVAISGNTILAGAISGGSGTPGNQGAAYIFATDPLCPSVSGVNPASGCAGDTVTITGTDFTGVTAVRFANNVAASFTINSAATQITTIVPIGAATGPITISKPNCPDAQTGAFTITTCTTPRIVRVIDASGPPGGTVSVPAELVSLGNENALGFSLTFDPAILSNPQAALGSGATAASLNINSSQVGQGRLGMAIALPSGQTFVAGVRQIVVVTFTIASPTTAGGALIGFADQPIAREVVGANAVPLPAAYIPGGVSFGYECDVAPRPNSDGKCTIADWVQCGRFVAGLDTPAAGSEFQRCDCAPRETKGDGRLTISDWVQCGRCAAGLDPIQPAGGPTTPVSLTPLIAGGNRIDSLSEAEPEWGRGLRAVGGTFRRGQINSLTIEFDAQGDENAVGFSLRYDPRLLAFAETALGAVADNAWLIVNAEQAASGRLGIALALPAGDTFAAGKRAIVTLRFHAAAGGRTAVTAVSFDDWPIRRQVANAGGGAMAIACADSVVVVTPR